MKMLITVVAMTMFLAGCNVLATTSPMVDRGCCLTMDGNYKLEMGEGKVPVHFAASYSPTNSSYVLDASEHGLFEATLTPDADGRILGSATLSRESMKKVFNALSESEMLFLAPVFVNFRLTENENGWEVWALCRDNSILQGARISSLDSAALRSLIPQSDSCPLRCVGTLKRLSSSNNSSNPNTVFAGR